MGNGSHRSAQCSFRLWGVSRVASVPLHVEARIPVGGQVHAESNFGRDNSEYAAVFWHSRGCFD